MLESRELTKSYNGKLAVDHISVRLEKGHIYAFLGPNGSGKTTWMKMAAGLVHPSSGQVLYGGETVGITSRRHIAYMSTEPYFYDWMTIGDAGRYYRDFFADFSMDMFRRLLNEFELDEKAKIKTLSSGMTAKVKIAVTLARDAEVYMLDEPFNGIDLLARDEIRACILAAAGSNKLLLLSSHLVEEMEAIADRAVFIREGRLLQVRDLSEMRERDGLSMADRYRQLFGHEEVNA